MRAAESKTDRLDTPLAVLWTPLLAFDTGTGVLSMRGTGGQRDAASGLSRINDRQRELLQWVAEGCPEGRFEGTAHRISVRALHTRGLVRIRGRGASWRCEITPAGQQHLDDRARPATAAPAGRAGAGQRPSASEAPRSLRKTDELVRDLVAAGGTLVVPANEPDGTSVRQRAYAAQAAGKLPEGVRLATRMVGDNIELRLTPAETRTPERIGVAEAQPVPLPDEADGLDPLAKRFMRSTERHEVSRASLERATRLVSAIVTEAKRRRWRVAVPPRIPAGRVAVNWQPARDRHIWITAAGVEFRIRVREEGVHLRGRHEQDQRLGTGSPLWGLSRRRQTPEGEYDRGATGRLELQLDGGRRFGERRRRSNWRDRQDTGLEQALPELFAEMATRVIEDQRAVEQVRLDEIARQESARRATAERERRWHELMDKATAEFGEDRRRRDLDEKLANWELGLRLEAFIQTAEALHGEDPEAAEWLAWAKAERERINPLRSAPRLPRPIEPSPEQLKPFLPAGWNPYRP